MAFQLHVSGLNLLARCGERFRRRYIDGEKTPPSVSMAAGTAVDAGVTYDLTTKILTGALAPDDAVLDCARDAAASEWERGVVLNQEDAEDGLKGSKDELIDAAVSLAGLHHQKLAPVLQPTRVQRPWVLDITGLPGTALQLAGTIDIQEGTRAIRDTKTSAKSPNGDTADISLQLTTYALAMERFEGTIPAMVGLDYLVRTPTRKQLKVVSLESTRTVGDFDHLLERVAHASLIIQSGIFTPAPLESWWCSAKHCPYHPTCRFARRPIVVAAKG